MGNVSTLLKNGDISSPYLEDIIPIQFKAFVIALANYDAVRSEVNHYILMEEFNKCLSDLLSEEKIQEFKILLLNLASKGGIAPFYYSEVRSQLKVGVAQDLFFQNIEKDIPKDLDISYLVKKILFLNQVFNKHYYSNDMDDISLKLYIAYNNILIQLLAYKDFLTDEEYNSFNNEICIKISYLKDLLINKKSKIR